MESPPVVDLPLAVAPVTLPLPAAGGGRGRSRNWCFTLNNPLIGDEDLLLAIPRRYVVFGREVGASGTPRLQGFVIFLSVKSLAQVKKCIPRAHLEVARGTPTQAADYCKKDGDFTEDGTPPVSKAEQGEMEKERYQRAWTIAKSGGDLDEIDPDIRLRLFNKNWAEEPVETRQLRAFMAKPLRDWQTVLLARIQQEDDRKIIMVHDDVGNSGKSIFSEFLEYKKLALGLPPLRNMGDLMQFAFGFTNQKCYLINMPRAIKKDKLSDFYSGIECLKNGVVWDKRYAAKKRRMDRPQIVVFTNIAPKWEFMPADRWEVYEMQADHSMLLKT